MSSQIGSGIRRASTHHARVAKHRDNCVAWTEAQGRLCKAIWKASGEEN